MFTLRHAIEYNSYRTLIFNYFVENHTKHSGFLHPSRGCLFASEKLVVESLIDAPTQERENSVQERRRRFASICSTRRVKNLMSQPITVHNRRESKCIVGETSSARV